MIVHTCVNLYERIRIVFVSIRVIHGKIKKRPRITARSLIFIVILKLLYNVQLYNFTVNLYEVGSVCEVSNVDSLVSSSIFDACNNLTE